MCSTLNLTHLNLIKKIVDWYIKTKARWQLNRFIANTQDLDLDIKKVKRFYNTSR